MLTDLNSFVARLLGTPAARSRRGLSSRHASHLRGAESLEARAMLSATYDVGTGVLSIEGTERADVISISKGRENGSVVLRGVDGVKRDTVFANVSAVTVSTLGGSDRVVVGSGIRTPTGGLMPFTIDAGIGNDRVDGGDGEDTIHGGDGNDQLRGRGGDDDIAGGNGNDSVNGDAGSDDLSGDDGNDRVFGGIGDDTISGGGGDDFGSGDDGDDSMSGDTGRDSFNGGNGRDRINGGSDDDSINGGGSDDTLRGDSGRDTMRGGTGNDAMSGGTGDDSLFGDDGDDDLDGDEGTDHIRGGRGADDSLDDDSIRDEDASDRRGRGSNSGGGGTSNGGIAFVGGFASVTGSSETKNDKQFYTFVAPADVSTLRVEILPGTNGIYADLEIEDAITSLTVVELEPSETGVSVRDGVALVAGRTYSLRMRAPRLDPAGFTVNLTVA